MNEEELINKVLKELDINPEWHKKQELKKTYGSKFVNSVIKLSFQKGKLEERERIIEVVKGFLGRNDYQRFIKALDKKISKISRKRRIGLE